MLVRRRVITGTLDPVRFLTGLTYLDLGLNELGGMYIFVYEWGVCCV